MQDSTGHPHVRKASAAMFDGIIYNVGALGRSHDASRDYAMSNIADEIKSNLQKLIGLKLSRTSLAADMRVLQFGKSHSLARGGVVGEYALHTQCPWRLENDAGIITGSHDLYDPYEKGDAVDDSFDWEKGLSLQEGILREQLQGYDENTRQIVNATNLLVVEDVQADSSGGFCLALSGGYRFLVFPSGTRTEAWRFFKPSTDEFDSDAPHFVVPHEV